MKTNGPDLILDRVPESVQSQAHAIGVDGQCLLAVRSDLRMDASTGEVWLVVTRDKAVVLASGSEPGQVESGPFLLANVQKVRAFQTVGSACMQFRIEGVYVDVVRYSNAYRERFSRICLQLDRLANGKPIQMEALSRPSDLVCAACGLPLPGRQAACLRCSGGKNIFFRTFGLMRPYGSFIALLLCMMVAGVSLDLLPPFLTKILVDEVLLPRKHIHWLPWILLGLVGASAGRHLLDIFIGRISTLIGTRITKELRERLQSRLVSLSVDYYDRHSAGSLMSRVLYDVDYFQGFVVQVAQGFLLNIMIVLGIGTVLFWMNWRLALLVLLPIPFVVVGTTFFWKYVYPRYYRLWDSQSKMAQLLNGLLQGIRLVKSFGQEERERERFSQAAVYMQDARRGVETSSATFNPIMGFIFGLGGLIIWYAGGHLVLEDRISLGTLMAFFGYMAMFYAPISALSMFSNWVTGFLSAGQRVFEVLDANVTVTEDPRPLHMPELKGAIELRNTTFGYDPYNPVLKNVSLRIEPGQFIGIVGKSGSGKTTLVNLICRFYDPQEGQVLIDGVEVQKIAQEDLHRQIALVLQEPFLFRATIRDNVAYGRPDAMIMDVMDAAKAANAHDFIVQRASAYDSRLGERGAGLSGGERQRVSIARALLCNPRILILDEATSSVDTASEQEIQKALMQLCRGRTTIAIAHRLSTLINADFIYVMDDGRIVESGTHENLLGQRGLYHNLVRIQTELTRLDAL